MAESKALVKMVIRSYEDRKLSAESKPFKEFTIPINPETFSRNYKIEQETKRPHGKAGTSGKFNATGPEEFKIDFMLDGTNTLQGYDYGELFKEDSEKPAEVSNEKIPPEDLVETQLQNFLDTVYTMNKETHRPPFCEIVWGTELFRGVVSNLDVNYSLFHPSGKPLRVKISATFLDYVAKEEREKRNPTRSPDLTRNRKIKEGDRLEKMVYDIYGESSFLIQVARANRLTTFRKVKTGTELRFPPVDKTETT